MAQLRFIHSSDLHLDTPFKGLSSWNRDLASKLKDATFKSFRKIVDLCLNKQVDFLLISGDIFESDNKSLTAQLKFISELKRLSDKGIPAYIVCGNHDPLNSWLDISRLPENVIRFGSSKVENHTFIKDNKPVADIYGISFHKKVINENLSRKYKLKNNPSRFSLAVLHGTAGAAGPHENYAPFKVKDVINKGFDYWALGHIHKRHIVHKSNPTIVYPGNPQGRDFGETGAKGCYLVEIDTNKKVNLRFIPVQLIRFEEIKVGLAEEDTITDLADRIENAKSNIEDYESNMNYIFRINLTGKSAIHSLLNKPGETEQLTEHFNEGQLEQTYFTWVDRIELNTRPVIDIGKIEKGNDFAAEILKTFNEYETNTEELKELFKNIEELVSPGIKKEIADLMEKEQKEILEKAKWKVIDRLIREK
jgi:DNA repair exonuclease SbcCD nuclease subunit